MARKGVRKSKKGETEKPLVAPEDLTKEVKTGPASPIHIPDEDKIVGEVNLRAHITDIGYRTMTVPKNKVDKTLAEIWRTGFKEKLPNSLRTHRIYGPQMIKWIDVEPVS